MIDTHAHLTDDVFCGGEEEYVKALNAGVSTIFTIGYNLPSSVKAAEFACAHERAFFAAGVHPSDCESYDNGLIEALIPVLNNKKCVAVGEIGLDFHYGKEDEIKQLETFESQIMLADKLSLPFIVHSREASKTVCDIICSHARRGVIKNGFLMHCYSESREQAANYLDAGGYFAFGGAITFKNAKKEDIIRYIPRDRIMCETDCPYMAPVPHRGEKNQPAFVALVYEKIAEIYGTNVKDLEKQIAFNVAKLFKKASASVLKNEGVQGAVETE